MKIYLIVLMLLFISCSKKHDDNQIIFSVWDDCPPFSYYSNDKIIGFDVDLAKLIGIELNKKVFFKKFTLDYALLALSNGEIDAIPSLVSTLQRRKNIDFSKIYYNYNIALLSKKKSQNLQIKKIACQLASSGEIWIKNNILDKEVIIIDDYNKMLIALNTNQVDAIIIDELFAKIACEKNKELFFKVIGRLEDGVGIALKKNSLLRELINSALEKIEKNGEMKKLKIKWGLEESK